MVFVVQTVLDCWPPPSRCIRRPVAPEDVKERSVRTGEAFAPSSGLPQFSEARASPVGRDFGRMARGLGRIPCRIARPEGLGIRRPNGSVANLATRCPLPDSFRPSAEPAKALPRVTAASPANRIMPSCFQPGPARLPTHPVSTHQPLVMISLRGARTWGRIRAPWRSGDKILRGVYPRPQCGCGVLPTRLG